MSFRVKEKLCGSVSVALILCFALSFTNIARSQIAEGSVRNFVTGVTPIIGQNGAVVGGVSIAPDGVISRADRDTSGQLSRALAQSIGTVAGEIGHTSQLRKISLRRLEQELVRRHTANIPLSSEIEFLAGLQRVEYVFVDEQHHDIILAGPAEGWRANDAGFVVGIKSGFPPVELGDLLLALRTSPDQSVRGITCSMDATEEGLKNYYEYLRQEKPKVNEQTLSAMRDSIGNFEIKFTGIPNNTNYARVLIAADLLMKRLGMNLEESPVRGVNSYLELLRKSRKRVSKDTMPRWWLATNYEPVLRDAAGLAWKIRGPGVKTMTEEDFVSRAGQAQPTGKSNPIGQRWADDFTAQYSKLAVELPALGQLRNCMDLAVLAALLNKYELFTLAGFRPDFLMDPQKIKLAEYPIPRFAAPQVSYLKLRNSWLIAVSGGIDIDGWSVAAKTQEDPGLSTLLKEIVAAPGERWWWD
jgi:hypothetical protein